MVDWPKLADYLDSQGTNQVRMPIEDICDLVGELPRSAYEGTLDYWRTGFVLPHLEQANWTTDLVDYKGQIVLFRSLDDRRPSGPPTWISGLRDLLEEAREFGEVRSIVASTTLDDGTQVTLNVEVKDDHLQHRHGSKTSRSPVSGDRPISVLASESLPKNTTVQFNDRRSYHWTVPDEWIDFDRLKSYKRFKDELRRRVVGITTGRGLGGYGCLATMSRKKSQQTGKIAAYSPAALGLRRVDDDDALYNLVLQDKLILVSIEGHGHDEADAIRIRVQNPTAERITLRIPGGTVFEQETTPEKQDLMVKKALNVEVAAGETTEIRAYGWCLDHDAGSPSGQALLLTPWILAADVDSQDDLWGVTEGPEKS